MEDSDDNGIVQNISPELKQTGVSPSQSSTSLEKVKYFPHNISVMKLHHVFLINSFLCVIGLE